MGISQLFNTLGNETKKCNWSAHWSDIDNKCRMSQSNFASWNCT